MLDRNLQHSYSLKALNTFNMPCRAHYFVASQSVDVFATEEFRALIHKHGVKVLGGGSNLVLLGDLDQVVIQLNNSSIQKVTETANSATFRVGAGLAWHDWVCFTVNQGLSGYENLALIPGTVGAAPIQNIGAYGVELSDGLVQVEALHLKTGQTRVFSKDDCQLEYRNSVFKLEEYRDQWLVLNVVLACRKRFQPQVDYPDVQTWFAQKDRAVSLGSVFEAVIDIRRKKLPDPNVLPNVGSFFKNPLVSVDFFHELQALQPAVKGFKVSSSKVKLAAGRLIELCGWKGQAVGGFQVHQDHALVLVNPNNGTAKELIELVQSIQHSVWQTLGVRLLPEPDVWGGDF